MAFKTRITELLEIEHPIVQGGMQGVGTAELASAVSNAGGLGILTALTQPTPAALREEIDRTRSMTKNPIGVNMTVFPTINSPDYNAYADAIIESGVKVVETAGTPAVREIWAKLQPHGIKIVHKCTAVGHALSAERNGCDAISIDGFECAGHPGADGINMGTRFCATQEAQIHPNVKQAYIDNDERGTNLIFRSLKNTARVGKSEVSDEVVRRLAQPGATFKDVQELVEGEKGCEMLKDGDLTKGIFWAGMIQGLIHDIPTCKDLIDRIISEAESIIDNRLASLRI
jgi:nitronate monooxygenase